MLRQVHRTSISIRKGCPLPTRNIIKITVPSTAADDKEDIAALIYQESQRRKREAAEAAQAVDGRREVTTKRTRQCPGTEEEEGCSAGKTC